MGVWWGRTRWNTPGLRAGCLLTPKSGKLFPLLQPENAFRYFQGNLRGRAIREQRGWARTRSGQEARFGFCLSPGYGGRSVEREGTVETACAVSQAVITALSCSDDRYATDHNPTTSWVCKEAWVISPWGGLSLLSRGPGSHF